MGGSLQSGLRSALLVRMCAANFMLSASCYQLVPLLCGRETATGGRAMLCGLAQAAFFVGMLLPGPFCARLVETCSRKRLFLHAALLLALTAAVPLHAAPEWVRLTVSGGRGILFGVAQVALGGTLVNDLLVSERRTAAGMLYAGCGRLAWPAGWMAGLLLPDRFPAHYCLVAAAGGCLLAWMLVAPLRVPLKAPLNVPRFSFDRFWQTEAWPLFLAALCVSVPAGMWMAGLSTLRACVLLLGGLMLGGGLRQTLLRRAGDRIEMAVALAFTAMGWILSGSEATPAILAASLFFGTGISLSASCLLHSFMTLSGHCRRGTSQNTCLLSWFMGLPLGLFTVCAGVSPLLCGLLLAALLLIYYLFFLYGWHARYRKSCADKSSDGPYCAQ